MDRPAAQADLSFEGDARDLPMALWQLHHAHVEHDVLHVALDPPVLERSARDVFEGAGFEVLEAQTTRSGWTRARIRRLRTLADTVGPGMRLLLVGLNPSLHAADSGVGFSGPSNRGWPALLDSGVATVDRDPVALLVQRGVGMTDIVKRATARASELDSSEYREGLQRLERLCTWLAPAAVCMVGLAGWRAAVDRCASAGRQDRPLGGRPVWLMPNPSGLNAHCTLEDLSTHLSEAVALAEQYQSP